MFTTIARFSVLIGLISLVSCSTSKPKINKAQVYKTETGFIFMFPMNGDWHRTEQMELAQYIVGQEPKSDGSSKLAMVKHDVFKFVGKPVSNKEVLNMVKDAINKDAAYGPRVSNVKTSFTEIKYKKADCLLFSQRGIDSTPKGNMNLSNEGKVCLHPKRSYTYVWMAISERVPFEKSLSDLSADKQAFFDSLDFAD